MQAVEAVLGAPGDLEHVVGLVGPGARRASCRARVRRCRVRSDWGVFRVYLRTAYTNRRRSVCSWGINLDEGSPTNPFW